MVDMVVLGLGSFLHDLFCSWFFWLWSFSSAPSIPLDRAALRWFVFARSGHAVLLDCFCLIRSRSFAGFFALDQVAQFRWFSCSWSGRTFLLVCLCLIKSHISAHSVSVDQVAYCCSSSQSSCLLLAASFPCLPTSFCFTIQPQIACLSLLRACFFVTVASRPDLPALPVTHFRSFPLRSFSARASWAVFGHPSCLFASQQEVLRIRINPQYSFSKKKWNFKKVP